MAGKKIQRYLCDPFATIRTSRPPWNLYDSVHYKILRTSLTHLTISWHISHFPLPSKFHKKISIIVTQPIQNRNFPQFQTWWWNVSSPLETVTQRYPPNNYSSSLQPLWIIPSKRSCFEKHDDANLPKQFHLAMERLQLESEEWWPFRWHGFCLRPAIIYPTPASLSRRNEYRRNGSFESNCTRFEMLRFSIAPAGPRRKDDRKEIPRMTALPPSEFHHSFPFLRQRRYNG